jgi:hypothetical protein
MRCAGQSFLRCAGHCRIAAGQLHTGVHVAMKPRLSQPAAAVGNVCVCVATMAKCTLQARMLSATVEDGGAVLVLEGGSTCTQLPHRCVHLTHELPPPPATPPHTCSACEVWCPGASYKVASSWGRGLLPVPARLCWQYTGGYSRCPSVFGVCQDDCIPSVVLYAAVCPLQCGCHTLATHTLPSDSW